MRSDWPCDKDQEEVDSLDSGQMRRGRSCKSFKGKSVDASYVEADEEWISH